jgi:hypothetical protein
VRRVTSSCAAITKSYERKGSPDLNVVKSCVGVEKVTSIRRLRFSRSMLMLWLIPIGGGLLIMMGQHDRSEALFYYCRLEDQVAENHLLRLIEKHISFEFVRERLRNSYSENGRPSIDPALLLRILLMGYLYGITSERRLEEQLRMHLFSTTRMRTQHAEHGK